MGQPIHQPLFMGTREGGIVRDRSVVKPVAKPNAEPDAQSDTNIQA